MLSVTNEPAMLSVIILNIVMESVVMLNVLAPYEPKLICTKLNCTPIKKKITSFFYLLL